MSHTLQHFTVNYISGKSILSIDSTFNIRSEAGTDTDFLSTLFDWFSTSKL